MRLPTTVTFPDLDDLMVGRTSPRAFWDTTLSGIRYWIQRLIARTNDELVERFGQQRIDGELVISGNPAKFGVGAATTRLKSLKSLMTTIDPPSIPANSSVDVTLTFTGVEVGECVVANPDSDLEGGLIYTTWAPAANTVRIRLFNVTAAAIDPVPRTWRVTALGFV